MTALPAKIRLFVSVDVATPVRERLRLVQQELSPAAGGAVRWTPPEQMHLTLRFFGDVEAVLMGEIEAAVRRACEKKRPFELRAVGLGGFPDLRQPRVIWVGVSGEVEALQTLQKDILRSTVEWGQQDSHEFRPHLTIGRMRDGRRVPALAEKISALAAPDFGNWRVSGVRLMQSVLAADGARHTELAVIKLMEQPHE